MTEGQQALDLLRRIAEALERAHPPDTGKTPAPTSEELMAMIKKPQPWIVKEDSK